MSSEFRMKPTDNGAFFYLEDTTKSFGDFLKKKRQKIRDVDEWNQDEEIKKQPGLLQILAWIDEGVATLQEIDNVKGYVVSHDEISQLSQKQASALGMPLDVPLMLGVQAEGNFSTGFDSIAIEWSDVKGIKNAKVNGAFLDYAGDPYRIPSSIYNVIQAIERYQRAPKDDLTERLQSVIALKHYLPEDEELLQVGDGFTYFRLAQADAFSLAVSADPSGGFSFVPVLYSKHVAERAEDGEAISESEQLLTEEEQANFVSEFKNNGSQVSYKVDSNVFIYPEKNLKKALDVVHKKMKSSAEERKEFINSPGRFLREALLPDNVSDLELLEELENEIDSSFIESIQYSERILQLAIWEPPKVSHLISKEPQEWVSEEFPITIDGQRFVISKGESEALVKKIKEGIDNGENHIDHHGQHIPCSTEAIDLIERFIDVDKAIDEGPEKKKKDSGAGDAEKPNNYFLEVKHNIDELLYKSDVIDHEKRAISDLNEPALLKSTLHDHQKEGLSWLQNCYTAPYPGCLLADDMGLGKTIQVLAFLAWLKEKRSNARFLVVAPTGLLKNWEQENDIHLKDGGLGKPLGLYGNVSKLRIRSGRESHVGEGVLNDKEIKKHTWVLTTYETLKNYHMSLAKVDFDCVVFDEVQKIKSPSTQNHAAVLTVNTDFRIGLSGTPIENAMYELWSIFDAVSPGLLGSLKDFTSNISKDDLDSLKGLKNLLQEPHGDKPSFILRRLKKDRIKGLPAKHENMPLLSEPEVIMPAIQADAYEQVLQRAKLGAPMLQTLQHMRGVSLHPEHPSQCEDHDTYILNSARLKQTFRILDEIHSKKEKALVFLENLKLQELLASILEIRYGERPKRINGSIKGPVRQDIVNKFQQSKGFKTLIVSPKAGGVGITLTAANHVIHLSRWWNPAVEDQCTDRAYRIGQKKDVHVYYPLAIHPTEQERSFDMVLNNLLSEKRQMASEFLVPTDFGAEFKSAFGEGIGVNNVDFNANTIEDIDVLGPLEFEEWSVGLLKAQGWHAYTTPNNDLGADGFGDKHDKDYTVIIQCKHAQDPQKARDEKAYHDLVFAETRADKTKKYILVALTNAASFNNRTVELASMKDNLHLVTRDNLLSWTNLLP